MGKRSDFERKPRDFYVTPLKAVRPLIKIIGTKFRYMEPCAGDGALIRHIKALAPDSICYHASDIEPQHTDIDVGDFFDLNLSRDTIITNPPWDRDFLHPMIQRVVETNSKAWLLFDADWMHTKQSAEFMPYCSDIISVGRVSWFGGTTGKDNCAWYRFGPAKVNTTFYGRYDES